MQLSGKFILIGLLLTGVSIGNAQTCGSGYERRTGLLTDIPGWGTISSRGGGESVLNCDACGAICDSLSACRSYECSPTELRCNVNYALDPTVAPYKDYIFCSRLGVAVEEPTCASGFERRTGALTDVPGWGTMAQNGVTYGGGQFVSTCDECGELCDLVGCNSYECSPTYLRCNLNTLLEPTAGTYLDYFFCSRSFEDGCSFAAPSSLQLSNNKLMFGQPSGTKVGTLAVWSEGGIQVSLSSDARTAEFLKADASRGIFRWSGWQSQVPNGQWATMSCWIKFVGVVPLRANNDMSNFGFKMQGQIVNTWVDGLLPDVWYNISATLPSRSGGDGNHFLLIFDSLTEENLQVQFADLRLRIHTEPSPCADATVGMFSMYDAHWKYGGQLHSFGGAVQTWFTYSLVAGDGDTDNSRFQIQPGSTQLASAAEALEVGSYSVRVRYEDTAGHSLEQALTVSVVESCRFQAPAAIHLSNDRLKSDQTLGAVVGVLTSTDEDGRQVGLSTQRSGKYDGPDNTGPWRWSGWRSAIPSGKTATMSCWIKFIGQVPQRSGNFGFKIQGQVMNEWLEGLTPDVWHRVSATALTRLNFDNNHFLLIFDTLASQQVEYAELQLHVFASADAAECGEPEQSFSMFDADWVTGNLHHGLYTWHGIVPSVPWTYSLVSGDGDLDNAFFRIDNHSDVLRATEPLCAAANFSVRVRSEDSFGRWVEQAMTITVVEEFPSEEYCGAGEHVAQYPLLVNAQYGGLTTGTYSGADILSNGTFEGVKVSWVDGFVSCDYRLLQEVPGAEQYAWQTCRQVYHGPWTMFNVTGAAFELKFNGNYVYTQPAWWRSAGGCSKPDFISFSNPPITCWGSEMVLDGEADTLEVGWYESFRRTSLGDNSGTITVNVVGLRCEGGSPAPRQCRMPNEQPPPNLDPPGAPEAARTCTEDEAKICHELAMCFGTEPLVTPLPFGNNIVDPAVEPPASSSGQFACACPPEQLGHGYGANGCSSSGWNVRVVFRDRWLPISAAVEETVLALMGIPSCTAGSIEGCDHVHYTVHRDYAPTYLGVNVLFPATDAGKAAAEAAVVAFEGGVIATYDEALLVADDFRRSVVDAMDLQAGARLYTWVAGTTSDAIRVLPAGMEVQNVHFEPSCAETGCFVIEADFTVGHSDSRSAGQERGFNTFFLPYAVGSDALSFDYLHTPSVTETFLPSAFPCSTSDYDGSTSLPTEATLCCFGTAFGDGTDLGGEQGSGFLGKYRATEAFAAYAAPLGVAGGCASTRPQDVLPTYQESLGFFGVGQRFAGMPNSPGITRVEQVDPFLGMYSATIKLDEKELRTRAGILRGTVGVEHTIDFFLGFANFKPATSTTILDSLATQTAIHVEKTSFFSVSTHGQNEYTFVEYVNLRLVSVFQEDADFTDPSAAEQTDPFVRTDAANNVNYLQVTFTLGPQYGVNNEPNADKYSSGLIPLDSVRVGRGTFLQSSVMEHTCQVYGRAGDDTVDDDTQEVGLSVGSVSKELFDNALLQECAPQSVMCASPSSIPDSFVSFNIPLGLEIFGGQEADDLSSNIFVDFVINAIDEAARAAMTTPNEGEAPWQVKTTLTASVPIVLGGINIFCDGVVAKTDLKDVADADLVFGTAQDVSEMSRLRVLEDIASSELRPTTPPAFETDSIEAGLMTLVLKGDSAYFGRTGGAGSYGLQLEDVISVHVMEGAAGGKAAAVRALLAVPGEDDYDSSTLALRTEGYALNGAFRFSVDRATGRAHLHPTDALLDECPFNPARPTSADPFPATCVTRRDTQERGFPARAGAVPTATEVQPLRNSPVGADVPADAAERDDNGEFMQTVLGESEYAFELGKQFGHVLGSHYDLNGQYRRAYWINPGYEWTPTQTGGRSLFEVSQKLLLFALISLDEGFAARRRVLLSDVSGTGAGLSAVEVSHDVSPRTVLAKAFAVPLDKVASYKVVVALSAQEACMAPAELKAALRSEMDAEFRGAASRLAAVELLSLQVDRGDAQCARRRARLGRRALASTATAEMETLIVFDASEDSGLDLEQLQRSSDRVVEASPLLVSDAVADSLPSKTTTPTPDLESSEGGSIGVAVIAGVCAGGGALLLCVGVVLYMRCKTQTGQAAQAAEVHKESDTLKAELMEQARASSAGSMGRHLNVVAPKPSAPSNSQASNSTAPVPPLAPAAPGGSCDDDAIVARGSLLGESGMPRHGTPRAEAARRTSKLSLSQASQVGERPEAESQHGALQAADALASAPRAAASPTAYRAARRVSQLSGQDPEEAVAGRSSPELRRAEAEVSERKLSQDSVRFGNASPLVPPRRISQQSAVAGAEVRRGSQESVAESVHSVISALFGVRRESQEEAAPSTSAW